MYVPPHPLIKHWLAVARNAQTPPAIFKSAITELSKILLYECVRDMLPTSEAQVETPMGVLADVEYVDPARPIAIVPVLRAGLAMAESAQTIVPASVTYHVGYKRDKGTLDTQPYMNQLPDSFDMDSKVVVMDIMLATGMPVPSQHAACPCSFLPWSLSYASGTEPRDASCLAHEARRQQAYPFPQLLFLIGCTS